MAVITIVTFNTIVFTVNFIYLYVAFILSLGFVLWYPSLADIETLIIIFN